MTPYHPSPAARLRRAERLLAESQIEIRDYKAATRFMHMIYKQQSYSMHLHLKREHKDVRHRAAYRDCPSSPCDWDRNQLHKVEAVIERYRHPGDPLAKAEGAA